MLGTELVRVDASGLDVPAAFRFAREQGSAALQALTYGERAALLARCQKVLQGHRDAYYDIALANSGTVKNDSAVDIDGAIFTLGQYARWGEALGGARVLPSTSRPGACGKTPRPRCCPAWPWWSSPPRPPPG